MKRDIRYCPVCGVDSLQSDNYRQEHKDEKCTNGRTRQDKASSEYLRLTCGFGFSVNPSLRYHHAETYLKQHRQLRPNE